MNAEYLITRAISSLQNAYTKSTSHNTRSLTLTCLELLRLTICNLFRNQTPRLLFNVTGILFFLTIIDKRELYLAYDIVSCDFEELLPVLFISIPSRASLNLCAMQKKVREITLKIVGRNHVAYV